MSSQYQIGELGSAMLQLVTTFNAKRLEKILKEAIVQSSQRTLQRKQKGRQAND